MVSSYEYRLIAQSVLIAVVASCAALNLRRERVSASQGKAHLAKWRCSRRGFQINLPITEFRNYEVGELCSVVMMPEGGTAMGDYIYCRAHLPF